MILISSEPSGRQVFDRGRALVWENYEREIHSLTKNTVKESRQAASIPAELPGTKNTVRAIVKSRQTAIIPLEAPGTKIITIVATKSSQAAAIISQVGVPSASGAYR